MNLSQLPYILAVASCGTLSSAAKKLNISQQALSKYLDNLEKELGIDLFFRYKKKFLPTDAGKAYLKAAQEILDIQTRCLNSINCLGKQSSPTLSIGVSLHRGSAFISKIYPMFKQKYPLIHLKILNGYSDTLFQMIQTDIITLASTTYCKNNFNGLSTIPIHSEEIVLALPAFHKRVLHPPQTAFSELPFAELSEFKESLFIFPEKDTVLYQIISPLFENAGFQPTVAFSTPNIELINSLVALGSGIGLVPAYYARPNDTIAYYRLYNPAHMQCCIIKKEHHILSKPEKYIIYLLLKEYMKIPCYTISWDQNLLDILQEFEQELIPHPLTRG